MKIKSTIIAFALTALLVTTGFFMPGLTGAVEDRRQAERIDRHEADSVRLDSQGKTNLMDKLRLASDSYTKVPLQTGVRLKEENVEEYAEKFAALLEENGLISAIKDWKLGTDSFLVISGDDPSLSGIIWNCVLGNDTAELMMAIDDETGMVLAFRYMEYEDGAAAVDMDGGKTMVVSERLTKRSFDVAEMLAEYYGFSWTFSDEQVMEGSEMFRFALVLTDEQSRISLPLTLTLADNHILFNG
ncbi:hypothetical protein [Agathobaculum sp.]|uniref:hypothetical protein n=1 Tax=Agathobaculum sp. TaxID=2048138 RepID=UPI002A808FA1|nr:hypothetical protein [Agathobaculum sp.]MDY3618985.1 hypothetical protein [Agathobaculum sp.]